MVGTNGSSASRVYVSNLLQPERCLDNLYKISMFGCCSDQKHLLGLGSVNSELMDNKTFDVVSKGLHLSLRISKQISPFLLMLQW